MKGGIVKSPENLAARKRIREVLDYWFSDLTAVDRETQIDQILAAAAAQKGKEHEEKHKK